MTTRADVLTALLSLCLTAFGAASVSGQVLTAGRETLKGLTGLNVVLKPIDADVQQTGLTQSGLQSAIELRLRENGIAVLAGEEWSRTPGRPELVVSFWTMRMDPIKALYFGLLLECTQTVLLDRSKAVVVYSVPTWKNLSMGRVSMEKGLQVEDIVLLQVDGFINDYFKVNPKRIP